MKRLIFASLLIAGLMISTDGFSQRYIGYRGGFRGGVCFAPRGFYRPAPVIYGGPVYAAPIAPAYGYGYPAPYYHGYYRGGYWGRRGYARRRW